MFNYRRAFVRDIPSTFNRTLRTNNLPVGVPLAKHQYQTFLSELRKLIPNITYFVGNDNYPDSPFIETLGVVINRMVFLNNMKSEDKSRYGENYGIIKEMYRMDLILSLPHIGL